MSKIKLNGSVRTELGTASSNRLRKQGKIPCVIYNEKGDNIYLAVEAKEFIKEYLKENIQIRPIEIETKDKTYNVLVYDLDLHAVKDTPIHVDFLNIEGKKEIKVFIPLEVKGKEKGVGLKRGGFLNIVKRKIQVWCSPEKIPTKLTADVSKLHIGEALKADKIKFPEGTRPVDKSNFVILSVTGRGKSMEEEEEKKPVEGEEVKEGAEAKPAEAGKEAKKPEGGEVKVEEKNKK